MVFAVKEDRAVGIGDPVGTPGNMEPRFERVRFGERLQQVECILASPTRDSIPG
jgi:hypothetical protein